MIPCFQLEHLKKRSNEQDSLLQKILHLFLKMWILKYFPTPATSGLFLPHDDWSLGF